MRKVVLAGLILGLSMVYVSSACLAAEKGLIFYVPFDGKSQPEIGKGAISEDGLEYVEGKKGKAVKFGKGAKLTYPTAGNLNKESGTVEFWLYWPEDRSNVNGNLFSLGKSKTPNSLLIFNSSIITLNIFDKEANYNHAYIPVFSWQPGEWHHVAVTYGGINSEKRSEWSTSVDGVCLDSRKGKIEIEEFPAEIHIGKEGMVIDELKVYDYAKSSNQIWQEIRPQIKKRVFKDTGFDNVISKRNIPMPLIDMGSYVLGGPWCQAIFCNGYRVLDGLGRIRLGKDASGKYIDSHLFRRKVEVVEYGDGHYEINWKAEVEKAGFEYTGKTLLFSNRIKYSVDYSFSKAWSKEVEMKLLLGGLLGASYKATDVDGNVTKGKFPDKRPNDFVIIPENPLGRIEMDTKELGKITMIVAVDDPGRSNKIVISPREGMMLSFSQNSGNRAGYSNHAELEIIFGEAVDLF